MLKKAGDSNKIGGIVISDESNSFGLTLRTYNEATANNTDVIIDKILEFDYWKKNQNVVIEFLTPVILSSKYK